VLKNASLDKRSPYSAVNGKKIIILSSALCGRGGSRSLMRRPVLVLVWKGPKMQKGGKGKGGEIRAKVVALLESIL